MNQLKTGGAHPVLQGSQFSWGTHCFCQGFRASQRICPTLPASSRRQGGLMRTWFTRIFVGGLHNILKSPFQPFVRPGPIITLQHTCEIWKTKGKSLSEKWSTNGNFSILWGCSWFFFADSWCYLEDHFQRFKSVSPLSLGLFHLQMRYIVITLVPNQLRAVPSGKRTNNYGKSPCLMGKSTN